MIPNRITSILTWNGAAINYVTIATVIFSRVPENTMLFSVVKFLRESSHDQFHWCLYNTDGFFMGNAKIVYTAQATALSTVL